MFLTRAMESLYLPGPLQKVVAWWHNENCQCYYGFLQSCYLWEGPASNGSGPIVSAGEFLIKPVMQISRDNGHSGEPIFETAHEQEIFKLLAMMVKKSDKNEGVLTLYPAVSTRPDTELKLSHRGFDIIQARCLFRETKLYHLVDHPNGERM